MGLDHAAEMKTRLGSPAPTDHLNLNWIENNTPSTIFTFFFLLRTVIDEEGVVKVSGSGIIMGLSVTLDSDPSNYFATHASTHGIKVRTKVAKGSWKNEYLIDKRCGLCPNELVIWQGFWTFFLKTDMGFSWEKKDINKNETIKSEYAMNFYDKIKLQNYRTKNYYWYIHS